MSQPGLSLFPQLNPAQRRAVEHTSGPMLVLAGAGSGKTRVLTARIAHLIDHHGVPANRIFAVTFTNRAAGEMKERVATLLGQDPVGLWIGTFHSLSARILRREAERIGFTRGFTIYDEDDRLRTIKRLMEQRNHPTKLFPPKLVQAVISNAKNRMQTPDALRASAPHDPLTGVGADVMGAMAETLRNANAMDFDDLMLYPLTLFRDHPDRLAFYQGRFHFVLVDEFQDTNRAQYDLVRQIGADGNLFVVGDDDQAIYGWRGADIRNLRAFQRDFEKVELVRLEENYRSTQIILDAANAAIEPNSGRLGKTLRTVRRGGEAITRLAAADERDEAEWIASEMSRKARDGERPWTDIAILYRTNAQSRALEEAFRRAGIPYRIIGAISFYDRREVVDLLAYLRLLINEADDQAFLRAISTPRRGIGETSLRRLQDAARRWGKPLLEAARLAEGIPELRPNVRVALARFADLVTTIRDAQLSQPPAAILEEVIRRIDFEGHLLGEGPDGPERWENVRELLAAAAAWSEVIPADPDNPHDEEEPPLERFLTEAALLSADDKRAGSEQGVTLMTLHTAKGLEWPVVVVAGLEDGLFPLARALETEGGLEEERRLFYVGMTRAKDKLYFSWARARRRGGELRPGTASRFLDAIPEHLLEDERTSSILAASWSFGGRPTTAGTRRAQWSGGPSVPEEHLSQDQPRYVKGERVCHRRFGGGVIQGLTGTGRNLMVSVAFDDPDVGVKQLMVAYAGLEREWESA